MYIPLLTICQVCHYTFHCLCLLLVRWCLQKTSLFQNSSRIWTVCQSLNYLCLFPRWLRWVGVTLSLALFAHPGRKCWWCCPIHFRFLLASLVGLCFSQNFHSCSLVFGHLYCFLKSSVIRSLFFNLLSMDLGHSFFLQISYFWRSTCHSMMAFQICFTLWLVLFVATSFFLMPFQRAFLDYFCSNLLFACCFYFLLFFHMLIEYSSSFPSISNSNHQR